MFSRFVVCEKEQDSDLLHRTRVSILSPARVRPGGRRAVVSSQLDHPARNHLLFPAAMAFIFTFSAAWYIRRGFGEA